MLALLLVFALGSDAEARGVAVGPAAGRLDRSFGTGGKVITDFGQSEGAAAAVAQPDGKIVVAGSLQDLAGTGGSKFLAARYLEDGRLDQGFGSGGMTTISFGVPRAWANDLALAPDGKLVLVGVARSGAPGAPDATTEFALARVNGDGSRDTSFGSSGNVTTDLGGTLDIAVAVAPQPDGKIVVAGAASQPGPLESNPMDFAIARYNPDGSLDTGFGAGGHTSTHFEDGGYLPSAVALQPDGKIVVVGTSFHFPLSTPPPVLMLVRYTANGTLDSAFGIDGRVRRANATGSGVAIVHGKILVGGSNERGLALWRYDADGSPDAAFGRDGVATPVGTRNSGAWKIAVQPDGEIVAAGSGAAPGGNADFAVYRFNPDGHPDPAFGTAGTQTTGFRASSDDMAFGLALARNGKIVLAGYTYARPSSPESDIAVARYHGAVCVVPNVVNRSLRNARSAIANARCAVGNARHIFSTRVSKERVISQRPTAGARQRLGTTVALVVSKGRAVE
jgi:uncharacterized delta-60 repeat protein